MCLSTITKTVTPTRDIVRVWKVFGADNKHLFYYHQIGSPKTRRWIKARKRRVTNFGFPGFTYLSGFHAYKKRIDARYVGNAAIPVEIRRVRIHGTQGHKCKNNKWVPCPVLVADKMRIPRDWRKYLR